MELFFENKIVEKFLKYINIDTSANEKAKSTPSSSGQTKLGKLLKEELENIGLTDVTVGKNGYVYASLPKNSEDFPTIGLIAHLDTAPCVNGGPVKPQLAQNFDGEQLLLNEEKNIVLDPNKFEEMQSLIGDTLITTDGLTLLGSDDKAGIAEIITVCEYLINNPNIPHGDVKIAFLPDEEIGKGTDKFNFKKFKADFAYTVDGGLLPYYQYECFNAADAKVTIKGINVHTGYAKNKMKNAIKITNKFLNMLPENQTPEATENYEGFYHVSNIKANESFSEFNILVRDHDENKFESKKELLNKIANYLNEAYDEDTVTIKITDTYYNMAKILKEHKEVTDRIIKAMDKLNIKAKAHPIRGGTDGAKLSFNGLPCPNLPTGGTNLHSVYECVSINQMDTCAKIILNILTLK